MSAQRLRAAARVLRERAEAATPGLWESVPAGAWTGRVFGDGVDGPGTEMVAKTSTNDPDRHSNAAYIATMHPGVGLALADWLDAEADEEQYGHDPHDFTHPHRLADLILGERVMTAWAARYSATEEPELTIWRDGVEYMRLCAINPPDLVTNDTDLRADIAARLPVRECEETQACTRHAMPDGRCREHGGRDPL